MMESDSNNNHLITIVASAAVTLIGLSLVPWSDITNRQFKDFNLIGDLMPQSDKTFITHEVLDPELQNLSAEHHDGSAVADSLAEPAELQELPEDFKAPERDGSVLIEDYSDGVELSRLKSALNAARSRVVRIAVAGDSYIEGDILTQDIRALLQDSYGGCGVGYMAAYSPIAGFRQSISQSGDGWTEHEIRKMGADDLRLLQGHYFTSNSNAKTTFRGTKRPAHTDSWTRSSMLFVSPNAGSIIMTLSDGTERTYDIQPSNDVQMIELNGFTTSVAMSTDIDGLKSLGLWFTGDTGISLDCMSLRGNSGISHRTLNEPVAAQMRRYINYDVVVLEFGINALSSEQTDYTAYANAMTQVVNKVRACYPNAVVLILGIGDRGQKHGSDVGSLVTAGNMVRAQRGVARSTHALFWDTRQAMGGEGSVVDWHRRGLINADYIHLNHKGGKALAEIFVKSLKLSICE